MRPDMHKVVIERPRWNPGPGKKGRRANLPDELLPKFEGIRRPHSCRKGLTDLLGPLRRWLQSQVGRSWNDVYSEACKVIKPDSVIRAHVKTHLLEFVERETFMQDGKVCVLDRGWRGGAKPVVEAGWGRSRFYVHPETGILKPIPHLSRRAYKAQLPKQSVTMRWIRKNVALQQIRGLWFECHFEVVPVGMKFKAYDHLLGRALSRSELSKHEDSYCLCVRKRQLSGRELKEHGLQNAPENVFRRSAVFRTSAWCFEKCALCGTHHESRRDRQCSAGIPACCIAGFQPAGRTTIRRAFEGPAACRQECRRYGRQECLRYASVLRFFSAIYKVVCNYPNK